MKHFYLFTAFFMTIIYSQAQIQNYSLNDVVDNFTVTDIEGNSHTLYDYTDEGKYVYIDFFFTTCGPCQETAPKFNEFFDKYGCGLGDVMCLSINSGTDNDAAVEAYDTTYGGSFNHAPIVSSDGGSASVDNNFNPVAYPTICLINPNNEIINLDIWPVSGVETFEATFPDDFNPVPMACTVGLNDMETRIDFSIFPNPSNGKEFSIHIIDSMNARVSIIDLLGKEVYSTTISSQDTKIHTDLPQGSYFVQIKTNTGNSVKKLIVQ